MNFERNLDYTCEKLTVAIDTLATGTGRLQKRLWHACEAAVSRLGETDFPTEVAPRFRELVERLDSLAGGEQDLEVALDSVPDDDAREIAKKIVGLFHEVRSLVE